MTPTIKDIARLSGVSIGTVSRVLNNKDRVHPQTRERVLAVTKRLDYCPSAFARGLVLNHTGTIMVLVPNIASSYFAEITKVIGKHCRERGYKTLLGDTDENPEVEGEYLRLTKDRSIDGIIVAPLAHNTNIACYVDMVQTRFPAVAIDTRIEKIEMDYVVVDNEGGAEMVVDYLYAKGHRKIAFVAGDIDVQSTYHRYLGYLKGHASKGLTIDNNHIVINQDPLEQGGVEGMNRLLTLSNPPTAIFAANDLMAIGCIGSVLRHGRRVPDDIAVVGFDDIDISRFIDIPLTTVAQPKEEIGQRAVQRLLDLIGEEGEPKEPCQLVLKPKLVVRQSA